MLAAIFNYWLCLLLLGVLPSQSLSCQNQLPDSPCSSVFRYQCDDHVGLYGEIAFASPDSETVQLDIEFSVGNRVDGYNGKIELQGHHYKEKLIEDVVNHRTLSYKVFFPTWQDIPPKVSKISVNGNLICSGPKISMHQVQIVTTVNLQHRLRVQVQPLSENSVPEEGAQNQRPNRIGNDPPRRFESNLFNFQPRRPDVSGDDDVMPGVLSNPFNFRPKMPKDPTKVYGLNPFFAQENTQYTQDAPQDIQLATPSSITQVNIAIAPTSDVLGNFPENTTADAIIIDVPGKHDDRRIQNNLQYSSPKDRNTKRGTSSASGQNFNRPTTQRPQVKTSIPPQRRPEENNNLPGTRQTQIGVMPKINADTIPFEDTCGRAVTINQLVFHGGTVQKGAYPWLAALFWANSSAVSYTVSYKCSATLISQLHVVTAAHCVKRKNRGYDETLDAKDLLVKLGKLNIQEWTYSPGEKIIAPKSITVHPDYISSHSDADIAVLELIERIEFTTTIRPICLWSGPTNLEVVVGKLGTVVGWGMDENGNITTSEPRQVSLPVVSHEDCLSSSAIFATQVTGRTFCAGFRNGSGPCNGDSGSAFALQQNGRWMLRGIVSISVSEHATRHCDLSNYVIFTDASKYVDWLLSFFK
ncbi:unnamed protein product [Acanthoscelides obtectus]|uniref:Peptidase S1 domain-containing protein n=1 Tax=Acanthoscelides obtectus TaxID=200917 RepID=A0A9P0PXG8_ACAOB|nr:unnamed protein product [Acanthoscelides obtectus]CAK1669452.1 Serine protease gd [Acanthoscelides obtectus]